MNRIICSYEYDDDVVDDDDDEFVSGNDDSIDRIYVCISVSTNGTSTRLFNLIPPSPPNDNVNDVNDVNDDNDNNNLIHQRAMVSPFNQSQQ